jgi:hypothetical protein
MKQWNVWPWSRSRAEDYSDDHAGALYRLLTDTAETKRVRSFHLSSEAALDLSSRIDHTRLLLGLSDSTADLVARFQEERIAESWFAAEAVRAKGRPKSG